MKPLHLITLNNEIRPAFSYIQFKDGNFTATDCHVLLISPQNEILPDSIYNELPNECYFLNSDWKNSKIDKAVYFNIENNIIECLDNKRKTLGFLRYKTKESFNKEIGIYPDCPKVIPTCKEAKENIAINPTLLNNLYLANNKDIMQMEFSSGNKGIRINFKESKAKGLIMPMIFDI